MMSAHAEMLIRCMTSRRLFGPPMSGSVVNKLTGFSNNLIKTWGNKPITIMNAAIRYLGKSAARAELHVDGLRRDNAPFPEK